ncbi:hypothetical protein R1sor_000729 [Riccia sorocarpa]|uniref:Ubiquitin-like protease family profile domain-containing protein n=1 Tax=Riccia sorocarpa TaxID=122646 RepID=A0ABD3GWB8_9MARC
MASVVELTRDVKELEKTVEGYTIDKSRAKRRKSDADKTAEKTARKSADGSVKKQVKGKATKSDMDTNDTNKETSKDVTEDETLDVTPSTTEDPAQAAIATPEEGQQAKKKKKTADEKDGSMVRHDLKLPPPVPRPFCEIDFNTIARFLDADDVRKEKDPKHKRQAPPMITTLKNFCAMTPRPEAKSFKISLDTPLRSTILSTRHPSWLEEHLERENIQHLFMTAQSPQKGFLLPPHIAKYANMLVAAEKETMLSTERRVDLGNLVRDGQKIITTVSNVAMTVFPYSAIYHLDSDEPRHDFKKITGVVARWLKTVLPEGWVIEHAKQVKVLRQTNGHDYGIHVMAMTRRLISIADSISLQLELRDLTSPLSTSDIEELRIRLRQLAMAS